MYKVRFTNSSIYSYIIIIRCLIPIIAAVSEKVYNIYNIQTIYSTVNICSISLVRSLAIYRS